MRPQSIKNMSSREPGKGRAKGKKGGILLAGEDPSEFARQESVAEKAAKELMEEEEREKSLAADVARKKGGAGAGKKKKGKK